MTRVFTLLSILVAAAMAVYLFAVQTRKEGTSAQGVTQMESQAGSAAAGTNLQGAGQVLQAWYAANGTYAGATLPPGSGVVLVRADATGYCLQTAVGTTVEHQAGPGGGAQSGPC
jgi:type II secretory pathway pseudopilin PulG